MALSNELLLILNDSGEPLTKRLNIARNAFVSIELAVSNKETILLEWMCDVSADAHSNDAWDTFYECLTSIHFKQLKYNQLSQHVVQKIVKTISDEIETGATGLSQTCVLQCGFAVLTSDLFQQYFIHDVKSFCLFVSTIMQVAHKQLFKIIDVCSMFAKKILNTSEYQQCFMDSMFDCLIEISLKLDVENCTSSIVRFIQQVIFMHGKDEAFLNGVFLNKIKNEAVWQNLLLNKLKWAYRTAEEVAINSYDVAFKVILAAYRSKSVNVHKYFVLMLHTIGFDVCTKYKVALPEHDPNTEVHKSLAIACRLLNTVCAEGIVLDVPVNGVSFAECVQCLVESVSGLGRPSDVSLGFLEVAVRLEPLAVDRAIGDVLRHSMLADKADEASTTAYCRLITCLYRTYQRLHRAHKLNSEMLRAVKSGLLRSPGSRDAAAESDGAIPFPSSVTVDVACATRLGQLLPDGVLHEFRQCVMLLSGKQVVSMVRTFVTHLDERLAVDVLDEGPGAVLYLEFVCSLTVQFLMAVRTAEHTTTLAAVTRFLSDIVRLRNTLRVFGLQLLKMKHNRALIHSFLGLCHTWGELVVMLKVYVPVDSGLDLRVPHGGECSACNITYLHGYLTSDQWSLLSQRINNFGEKPCKQLMQRLVVQKLKAMVATEADLKPEVELAAIKSLGADLENSWAVIVDEPFVLHTLLPKMAGKQILAVSQQLVQHVTSTDQRAACPLDLTWISGCKELGLAIVYTCLSGMDGLLRSKRKHATSGVSAVHRLYGRVMRCVDAEAFTAASTMTVCLQDVYKVLDEAATPTSVTTTATFDEGRLLSHLRLLSCMPAMCHWPAECQLVTFLCLLSLCLSLDDGCEARRLAERLAAGLAQNPRFPSVGTAGAWPVLSAVLRMHDRRPVLSSVLNKCLRDPEATVDSVQAVLDQMSRHPEARDRLEVYVLMVDVLAAMCKGKHADGVRAQLLSAKTTVAETLLRELRQVTATAQKLSGPVTEGIALCARHCPEQDSLLDMLEPHLDAEESGVVSALYQTFLRHRWAGVPAADQTRLLGRAWQACRREVRGGSPTSASFIFEQASGEQFVTLLDDLLKDTATFLSERSTRELAGCLDVWREVAACSLSSAKRVTHALKMRTLVECAVHHFRERDDDRPELGRLFIKLQASLLEGNRTATTGESVSLHLQTVHVLMSDGAPSCHDKRQFPSLFTACVELMAGLLKHARYEICDRLPAYLAVLRLVVANLCRAEDTPELSGCAHQLDRLVKLLCGLGKELCRLAPYLISDLLSHYETRAALCPPVRQCLDNCLTNLMDLLDNHAVGYLSRTLSPSSTELFKSLYDTYKKYHRFTGKI